MKIAIVNGRKVWVTDDAPVKAEPEKVAEPKAEEPKAKAKKATANKARKGVNNK